MPRPRSPGGKRVTICAKFSDGEAAEIEAARGSLLPGVWLREAALAYARRPPERSTMSLPGIKVIADERMPPGTAVMLSVPGQKPTVIRNVARRCTHPGTRVIGGYCGVCDVVVLPGGLLPS